MVENSISLQDVATAIDGMKVTPPIPDNKVPIVPLDNKQEAHSDIRDQSSSWAAYIEYTNAKGEHSERRLICRKIEGYGNAEIVKGWCCESKQTKSFRIDRISSMISCDTGEILDPPKHFEMLRLHGSLGINDRALTDFMKLNIFMAKCDDHYHPLEIDKITESVEKYVMRFGGDDRLVETSLDNSNKLAPDSIDFMNALENISNHPQKSQLARLLLNTISDVVVADGKFHSEEIAWSLTAGDYLKRMATL